MDDIKIMYLTWQSLSSCRSTWICSFLDNVSSVNDLICCSCWLIGRGGVWVWMELVKKRRFGAWYGDEKEFSSKSIVGARLFVVPVERTIGG